MSARVLEWCERHRLTTAERDVLFMAANDCPREEIADRRGVKPSTLKKQISLICGKTQSRSLDHAVVRLALYALAETHPFPIPFPGIEDEAPHVCPGCHAVNARCAPDCIDNELANDLDDADLRDDAPDEEWDEDDLDGD